MATLDRLKESVTSIVNAIVGRRLDYLAFYPAKVLKQNADKSLEVRGDDARIGDISNVTVRLGIPGVDVVVDDSAEVMIGFENGNPKLPFAAFWSLAGVKELHFGGTAGIARVGDPVSFTLPVAIPITGLCALGPFVGTLMIPPSPITGKITTGSGKVKAA